MLITMVMDYRQSERQRNHTEAKEAGKCRERKALILPQLGAVQRHRDNLLGFFSPKLHAAIFAAAMASISTLSSHPS
jgi:hypothetical protein